MMESLTLKDIIKNDCIEKALLFLNQKKNEIIKNNIFNKTCEDPDATIRAALYAFYNLQLLSCFRGDCDCANCANDKFKLLLSGSLADVRKLFCPKIRQPNMEAVSLGPPELSWSN